MQSNPTVRAFPLDRAAIRRLAAQDAAEGKPMLAQVANRGLSGNDQISYEHAYVERQRDNDAVIAECA